MIFIAGILFIVMGIVMLVKFFVNNRRPKVDALVLALMKEAPPGQFIDVPHALVEYYYQNTKYNGKVLLASKPTVGSSIKIAVKPQTPTKAVEYYPKREITFTIVAFVLGIGLIVASVLVNDMLQ